MIARRAIVWMLLMSPASTAGLRAEVPPLPERQRIPVARTHVFSAFEKDPMRMPTDVAVDRQDNIYVADGVNHRVVIFTSEGEPQGVIREVAGRRLAEPVGLAMDVADRLWITDAGHSALIVFDEASRQTGQGGRWIDLPRSDDGRPCDPTDVAITRDGRRIWLVDNDHHRLMFREAGDETWSAMGGPGTGLGQFQWPFMLAIGPGNDLYVTEAIGARVQRVTPELRWAGQIGRWGIRPGELYRPKGVVVDGDERVYVSDSTLGVVQVFGSDGRFEGVLAEADGRPYRFAHPMGMAFDSQANLYVVELKRDTVTRVTLARPPATQPAPASIDEEELK